MSSSSELRSEAAANLSSTRFITLSDKDSRITQHGTRAEAEEFAKDTNAPDNAVYVFELKGAYSYPYSLTYP